MQVERNITLSESEVKLAIKNYVSSKTAKMELPSYDMLEIKVMNGPVVETTCWTSLNVSWSTEIK